MNMLKPLKTAAFYAMVGVVMIPTVFVFYWMVSLSLKPPGIASAHPPIYFGFPIAFDAYVTVFEANPFLLYMRNSLIVAGGVTILSLLLGVPAAYSIAQWKQERIAAVILVARIIPAICYLIPWYILFRGMGMLDTFQALILTHLVVGLPMTLWIMVGFFEGLPDELRDAAIVDGCSEFGAFWRIALPLVRPGLVTAGILAFIFSWNNFLFSVILAGRSTKTLPIAVFDMIGYEEINWPALAAAATLITLPVVILTLLLQRHIVAGMTMGAVKG